MTAKIDDSETGYIFVWCRHRAIHKKIAETFPAHDRIETPDTDAIVRCYRVYDLDTRVAQITECLDRDERTHVRVLHSETLSPALGEFGYIQTLEQYRLAAAARWLGELLVDRSYKAVMQPIVHANDFAKILGYEFLLRGLYPDGREISAPYLFETAEEVGMLYPLDLAGGEEAARVSNAFAMKEKVFINVLPQTIKDDAALDAWLAAVLRDDAQSKGQLVFEFVETQEAADAEVVRSVISRVRERNIGFALDDFGTGFNNLSTLTEFRPDYIKLDKSLINGIQHDAFKWNLLANIVDAARQVGTRTIAEGVENEETCAILLDIGVDFMQGYFFGYPIDTPVGYKGD